MLKIVYATVLRRLLTHTRLPNVLVGIWADSRFSSWAIPVFIKKYNINTDEIAEPIDSFKTLNDFFIRTLKKDARPLAQADVVSPADGTVLVVENIVGDTPFPIKGTTFNLERLLKNHEEAQRYQGGTAFIFRLAPGDYHRMHFMCDGIPSKPRVISGVYESVDPYVYTKGIQPLEVNERHHITYTTHTLGTVAIIPVGALFVGSISYTYLPGEPRVKGDEMGYFSFGGSTIVVLFQKGVITVRQDICDNSAAGIETPIKMGEACAMKVSEL